MALLFVFWLIPGLQVLFCSLLPCFFDALVIHRCNPANCLLYLDHHLNKPLIAYNLSASSGPGDPRLIYQHYFIFSMNGVQGIHKNLKIILYVILKQSTGEFYHRLLLNTCPPTPKTTAGGKYTSAAPTTLCPK